MKALVLAAALSLTAGFAFATDDHDHDHEGEAEHLFEAYGLHILHPWTRATEGDETLVFLEIENEGDAPVSLIGARGEEGEDGTLVGFTLQNGDGTWVALDPIPMTPEMELHLEPQVLALHITGLDHHLEEGHHMELVLITSAGEIEIEVAIEAADAMTHSHAGHSH